VHFLQTLYARAVKHLLLVVFLFTMSLAHGQQVSLVFPDSIGWNILDEGQELRFQVKTTPENATFSVEGTEDLQIQFDTLGNFFWKPSFDLVDRVTKTKDFTVIFQASFPNGKRERKAITFTVNHVNRPPVVEELPVLYVKQSTNNTYQIGSEYAYDPDGDPIVFRTVPTQMPENSSLTSLGLFTWAPSRSQFASLRNNPLYIEFIVQDQPDKVETRGRLKISQTQQDLPPELLIVPGDSVFTIKEDETLNLKLYISDPNGDDNIRSAGFLANDQRIPTSALKENTQLQYEFTWSPGYDFVDDALKSLTAELTFFVLDKSNNRTQRKVKINVVNTENMMKRDGLLFMKYRTNLADAQMLIQQLDVHQKKLNDAYKKAKKGKKNRSILNASFGAVTGFTPIVVDNPDQAKAVSAVGGTTVLTLGTLEATEVIGRSKENILETIKITIDIRNKVQSAGDEFARKYALKSARRVPDFDKDIDKLRATLNDQRIVLLELDAYSRNASKIDDKAIKKYFFDYAEDSK
jgi:hypothetical protein